MTDASKPASVPSKLTAPSVPRGTIDIVVTKYLSHRFRTNKGLQLNPHAELKPKYEHAEKDVSILLRLDLLVR
jgi:hypothetical protein